MPDTVSPEIRSRMMAGIKGKDTKQEVLIRQELFKLGYRYRLHAKHIPGKPDLFLKKYRTAIFLNGCFWHGHDCHLYKVPSSRTGFWLNKISGNKLRDTRQRDVLLSEGWRYIDIWECALKGKERLPLNDVLKMIIKHLKSNNSSLTIRGRKVV